MLFMFMCVQSKAGCVRCREDGGIGVYGSPNVHVCMQINFALNTKSERQVVPVYVSLSLQQNLHPLSRDVMNYQAYHSGCLVDRTER